jgi:hypothetical protein
VISVLAAAGINDFLQTGFSWCRAGANTIETRAAREESPSGNGAAAQEGARTSTASPVSRTS